ncbi:MAG: hypothetical protein IPL52_14020 [Flavobacteriales bacterium]|nr:hypothetical protein [Flavobacteriales bacterium]
MHKSSPIGTIAMWAIGVLGAIFTVLIFMGKDIGIDGGLWIAYLALGVAVVAAIAFAALSIDKKSLISIGGFFVLVILAYLISGGETRPEWNITEGTSKWIGAGLILTYISLIGAVGAILYGEITRMIK